MEEPRRLGGRYELGAVLGRGGMAEVYLAHDTRLGRTVAVKTLRADLARDPSFQARFRREAQSAASLNHPAIVAVYDTGEDYVDGVSIPYIVMEYVDGSTLRELLHSGRKLLPERALEMTVGILQALEYSHRAGIVHRDIKPANVMLTRNGQVKVMDFGIARAMGDSGMTMTQTAAVIGTAQYLSPEQAKGEQVDARSDLYSTGCLLFELLTVRPPFIGDSPVAVAYQHVREEPQPPSVFDPEVTPSQDAIVLKALAKDPDHRYQSADEMRADIERSLDGIPIAAPVAMGAAGYGAGGYGDGAPTTALPPQDGGPRTSMMPPMHDDDDYGGGGRASRRPPKKNNTSVVLLILAALLVLAGAFFVGKAVFGGDPNTSTTVPNVIGEKVPEAQQAFENKGLKSREGEARSCDEAKGLVCATDPKQGTTIDKGDTVTYFVSKGPEPIEVPDVVGDAFDDAERTLEDLGFNVERKTQVSEDDPDTVIKQSLEPKSEAPPKTTIVLTVAVEPEQIEVTNVVGQQFDAASESLKALGLNVVRAEQDAPGQPENQVIAQSIPAGSKVDAGTSITLTVPKAAQKVQVPQLVGKTVQQAQQELQAKGLQLAVGQGQNDPNAQIVAQNPQPGQEVDPGSTVTVAAQRQEGDGGGNGGNGNGGGNGGFPFGGTDQDDD